MDIIIAILMTVIFVIFFRFVYVTITAKKPKQPKREQNKDDAFRRAMAIADLKLNLQRAKMVYKDKIENLAEEDPASIGKTVGRIMKK